MVIFALVLLWRRAGIGLHSASEDDAEEDELKLDESALSLLVARNLGEPTSNKSSLREEFNEDDDDDKALNEERLGRFKPSPELGCCSAALSRSPWIICAKFITLLLGSRLRGGGAGGTAVKPLGCWGFVSSSYALCATFSVRNEFWFPGDKLLLRERVPTERWRATDKHDDADDELVVVDEEKLKCRCSRNCCLEGLGCSVSIWSRWSFAVTDVELSSCV